MKKLLIAVVLVALGAGAAYYFLVIRGARSATCERVFALCGSDGAKAGGNCSGELATLERTVGVDALRALDRCVATAPNCAKAAACLAELGLDTAKTAFAGVLDEIAHAIE